MVSPTTSEVGVPRAQGRARIRPSGLRVLRRHPRLCRPTRIGAEIGVARRAAPASCITAARSSQRRQLSIAAHDEADPYVGSYR